MTCTDGALRDIKPVIERAHAAGALAVVAADLLALALVKSPGELGALAPASLAHHAG